MIAGDGHSQESSRSLLDHLRPDDSDLAYRDELTDLYNRRLLSRVFEESWDDIIARCRELSFIMIDLDLFKEVNDRYGHLSGDEVLRVTAGLLRDHFRRGDLIFRYGGDEFLVILPGAGSDEAGRLAERARLSMSQHEFFSPDRHEKINVPLTFCIGVASYPGDGLTPAALIAHADEMMYDEKQQARRRSGSSMRLLSRVAIAVLLALIPAIMLLRWDDIVGLRQMEEAPSSVPVAPPPVDVQTLGVERMLLLEQIEKLEQQIEELRESQDDSGAPEVAADSATPDVRNDADIEGLRRQIASLTAQLQTDRLEAPQERPLPPADPPPSPPATSPPRIPQTVARSESIEIAPPPRPQVVSPPRLMKPIQPRYPRIAHRLGKEAVVELIVRIDSQGRVAQARIVGPRAGFGFEDAAIEAALRSKWAPGRRDGRPEEMDTGLRVTFQIPR